MPEGIEAELYRGAAARVIGRPVRAVEVHDPAYVRGGLAAVDLAAALVGTTVRAARRRGKVVYLDHEGRDAHRVTLALRFGMTGRLLVDGDAVIDRLEYASARDDPAWDRFVLHLDDGGALVMRDQRRLGSVELDPDEDALGPDASTIDTATLAAMLGRSSRPLKSRLLDQAAIAGLGNLLCDEILWRAALHPARPADSLTAPDVERLAATIVATIADLTRRGGSHTGDLQPHRHRSGRCPIDGAPIEQRNIGGRTTYACADHQAGTEW